MHFWILLFTLIFAAVPATADEIPDYIEAVDTYGSWVDTLYVDKDYARIQERVEELLNQVPNEPAARELKNLYAHLGALPDDFKVVSASDEAFAELQAREDVLDAWIEAEPTSHIPHVIWGQYQIELAWNVRGGGWAKDVPKEAWPKFGGALLAAQEELEKALELNPKDPNAASLLITVAMGLGLEPEVMETYYAKAVEADPSHYAARSRKLLYLNPKWSGTFEQMFDFAKECYMQAQTYPRFGQGLAYAHLEVHRAKYRQDEESNHLGQEKIWKNIEWIYKNLTNTYPEDLIFKMEFAYYANLAGKDEIAMKYFDSVGNRWEKGSSWSSWAKYNKTRVWTYRQMASASMSNKKFVDAEQYFLKIIEADPFHGDAYLNLSWINGEFKRDMEKTKMYAQKALTCDLSTAQEASANNYILMAERMGAS